jgi:hypothetical protein
LTDDAVLFFVLQAGVLAVAATILLIDKRDAWRAGGGPTRLTVTRSPASMTAFYGTYVWLTALLVQLCLGVEVVKNYRVLWALLDVPAVAYVCLGSFWLRNKIAGWANSLTKETR